MGSVRSTGNSTRGCLPLLETDNSVFGQGGVAEHGDRVMDNHHVLLISRDRPALVVQGPLQCFIWVYVLFVVVSNSRSRHRGRHNQGHIPDFMFSLVTDSAGKVYDYSLSRGIIAHISDLRDFHEYIQTQVRGEQIGFVRKPR